MGLCMLVLLSPGCERATSADTSTPYLTGKPADETDLPQALAGAKITFTRDGGFAGTNDKWTVYGDGRFSPSGGPDKDVELTSLAKLLARLQEIGFFSVHYAPDPFSPCADCYTYTLSVTYQNRTNQISWQDGDADLPETIERMSSLIMDFFILNPP